jgi:membrane-bound lytic murein transglycosylase D
MVLVGCASSLSSSTQVDSRDGAELPAEERASGDASETGSERLVAEGLEAVESARVFWQEGDIDSALATLDYAYELLLQLPDDPNLMQQKEDLRYLVSRLVVDVHGSQLTTAVDLGSSIPLDINADVQREISRFRTSSRQFFLDSYRRSGQYRPMILRKLRAAGLPEELSWLPLVESGFKNRALSSARALGMWQFISSTGSRYGLDRSQWIDERMDPAKSTDAAIGYLTNLHGMFGDWMLALAAYNCGENRVQRLIRGQRNGFLDRFWDLYDKLPRETRRYVPRLLATLLIVNDPVKYGFELPEPMPPIRFEVANVSRHVRLADLDKALGLKTKTLAVLNPELRHGSTPGKAYALKVPAGVASSFDAKLAALPVSAPPAETTYARHRVRRGETLSTIARRYGSSVNAIARASNLRSRHRIRVGQRLKIPRRGGSQPVAKASSSPGKTIRHTVRRGDSLWNLASRHGTTVNRIKAVNGLRGDRLAIGQKLVIKTGSGGGTRSYTVRRGDTIGGIANRQNVSINAILRANGLSRKSTIYPGQVLRVPGSR